jgi:excisionase family DNA binding protein
VTSDELLSIPATAAKLGGISTWTVRMLIRTRQLGYVPIGRRRMVPASELDRFIATRTVAAAGGKAKGRTARKEQVNAPAGGEAGTRRLLDIRALCS